METKTKICSCCGRELPIENFKNDGFGHVRSICSECMGKKIAEGHRNKKKLRDFESEMQRAKNARLEDFTPRELMAELKRRGYDGKLTYTKIETIDLSNF